MKKSHLQTKKLNKFNKTDNNFNIILLNRKN